jgi:hypothetical protein
MTKASQKEPTESCFFLLALLKTSLMTLLTECASARLFGKRKKSQGIFTKLYFFVVNLFVCSHEVFISLVTTSPTEKS